LAGVAYDQVQVNGVVNINADVGSGADLDVVLGFTPSVGDTFAILENDASDLVVGFFADKPQSGMGTFDVVNGADTVTFEIDYAADDGNDIELTVLNVVQTPAIASIAASSAADDGSESAPASLRSAPLVELVPDEDVLVFDRSAAKSSSTDASAPAASFAPGVLALMTDAAAVGADEPPMGDEADSGVDPGTLDNLDLIGLPGDGALSHDLYV